MKFILSLLALFGYSPLFSSEVKISPELEEFIEIRPITDELLHKNSYIGWVGINYPGDDWMTINHIIYKHNDAILNQGMINGNVATTFIFQPEQKRPHLPSNPDLLPKLSTYEDQENALLYLTDFFKE